MISLEGVAMQSKKSMTSDCRDSMKIHPNGANGSNKYQFLGDTEA